VELILTVQGKIKISGKKFYMKLTRLQKIKRKKTRICGICEFWKN